MLEELSIASDISGLVRLRINRAENLGKLGKLRKLGNISSILDVIGRRSRIGSELGTGVRGRDPRNVG